MMNGDEMRRRPRTSRRQLVMIAVQKSPSGRHHHITPAARDQPPSSPVLYSTSDAQTPLIRFVAPPLCRNPAADRTTQWSLSLTATATCAGRLWIDCCYSYSVPDVGAEYCDSLFVCLSVCPHAPLRKHMTEPYQTFCARYI